MFFLRTLSILAGMFFLLGGTELSASFFHPHSKHQPSYKIAHKNHSVTHLYGGNKKNQFRTQRPHVHVPKKTLAPTG
jgi:hypothetical protein